MKSAQIFPTTELAKCIHFVERKPRVLLQTFSLRIEKIGVLEQLSHATRVSLNQGPGPDISIQAAIAALRSRVVGLKAFFTRPKRRQNHSVAVKGPKACDVLAAQKLSHQKPSPENELQPPSRSAQLVEMVSRSLNGLEDLVEGQYCTGCFKLVVVGKGTAIRHTRFVGIISDEEDALIRIACPRRTKSERQVWCLAVMDENYRASRIHKVLGLASAWKTGANDRDPQGDCSRHCGFSACNLRHVSRSR